MTRIKESQDEALSGKHGSVLRAYELWGWDCGEKHSCLIKEGSLGHGEGIEFYYFGNNDKPS